MPASPRAAWWTRSECSLSLPSLLVSSSTICSLPTRMSLRARSLPTPTCVFAQGTPSPGALIRACSRSTSTCTPWSSDVGRSAFAVVTLWRSEQAMEQQLELPHHQQHVAGVQPMTALWRLQLLSLIIWPDLAQSYSLSNSGQHISCQGLLSAVGIC